MPHRPLAYLNPALRSRLIRAALNADSASDIIFLLEELELEKPLENTPEELQFYLQSLLARLARDSAQEASFVRCCEGLAQFYLFGAGEDPVVLREINQALPPGLSFSLKSGRLLLEPLQFYAEDNLFVQESRICFLDSVESETLIAGEPKEKPELLLLAPELPEVSEPVAETPESKGESRQSQHQRIVTQRMHMLKNQLTGWTGP
ncbi:hypothetical protein COW36_22265 [bacterium (Candidatus Blackallbacteria) CG17_big_fil_post_rev_8_21_14_2_50_48_46]|uniref:Uncharacterized protein n=1 Tax=bacterium (Candidatus Blackallbacteria) CG17_big_fil_post_rev_8_21_14_2_50_48_46 TaxID=2014261 RepID=A0A2M7FZ26_9BACT|nr:MAG: hypothetical protein COW64_13695 [bacterium (Candidatus Blackallbacteria) CG18_big_fil_WC_8_21_14_2_50_49_26]PIW14340.1 MAG: hypothetical protein COW36_22265 [bacterium (Candidatus Blackallbacteria) CG17_big_fil_post_rev_8_21_14_2_50_48_46]PIW45609.1 MAG: hypothetical protein COW20_19870 [bacterium (Candidatus Blackallbacteria) CG13_big_fil_rev_8_21_14_2_50_49_14]